MTLTAATQIDEAGAIGASLLQGGAGSHAVLTGANPSGNRITTLGRFIAGGNLTLADTGALAVVGPVSAANATLLTSGDLTIPGMISTGALTLTISGAVTEGERSSAASLTGSSGGATGLTGTNTIPVLNAYTAAGGFTLTDNGNLALNGIVSGGPAASITDAGTLTLNGSLNAGMVSLTATAILEAANGSVNTPLLSFATNGTAALTGTNQIAQIGGFSAGQTSRSMTRSIWNSAGRLAAPRLAHHRQPVRDHTRQRRRDRDRRRCRGRSGSC